MSTPALATAHKPRAPKLAERLAERIEAEVMASAVPIGTSLGFEPELMAKYAVSRSVLREAISILERGGLMQMRRGRRGGLTVAASPQDAAVHALQNYISFVDYLDEARVDELFLVRQYLEPVALRQAARLADEADEERLRALATAIRSGAGDNLRNTRQIVRSLFDICRNPASIVLIRVIVQMSLNLGLSHGMSRQRLDDLGHEILALRLPQIEALIAGDLYELIALQLRQIGLMRDFLMRNRGVREEAPPATLDLARGLVERFYELSGVDNTVRQSDVVVQFILYELWRNNWRPGHHLGVEPELVAWIGTTKDTFREGLRVLERIGVVTMATGPNGGLVVSTPDPKATLATAKLCLQALGVTREQIAETTQALVLASISELIHNPRADRPRAGIELQNLLNALPAMSRADRDLQFRRCLAAHCGNRVLDLFTQLLTDLFAGTDSDITALDAGADALELARYREIVAAIEAGDAPRARRRMIRIQLALGDG
jgi:DNA-binding FadR family transcriptional regulator